MKRTSSSKASVEGDGRSAFKLTKPFGVKVQLAKPELHDGNNFEVCRRDSDARHPLTKQYSNKSAGVIAVPPESAHLSADDLK
jgi:hypothetical protein